MIVEKATQSRQNDLEAKAMSAGPSFFGARGVMPRNFTGISHPMSRLPKKHRDLGLAQNMHFVHVKKMRSAEGGLY